ncbi:Bax inhibitor-1/YccA family protein [Streptosporangium sp. NBC_01755]|uniref:Bax inhibitor-1/YccA family protein n=1 Tax=unclassified Streptosporangium TaxID=2632669 RepID=UPI002DDB8FEE|nr:MULTISPECIES: Bax inhibitor-1/YccA family protein [unclassified Streptosporangium]WSA26095.1 Bax inhibitor-1/YccA family protein [Streptosporangium sp. NBC_01810]WSD02476.1 Bax inhibitor-1/YccA family protein [Streptosporangium sp. NBC_01755]
MESKNPVFSRQAKGPQQGWGVPTPTPDQLQGMYNTPSYAPPAQRTMTIDDVVVRGFITLGTLVVSAAVAWVLNLGMVAAIVGVVVGLVLALIISFKQSTNPALILGYSVSYGVAIGVISHVYNNLYSGIVFQAVLGTALAFGAMLTVYALRIIRVTPKFTKFVVAAGLGLMGLMLVNLLAGFFIEDGIGIRSGGPLAYVFSIAAILIGCFFLLLDFDEVERGVRAGAPEKYSWLMAFGLTVTLVWIYLEILRLLSYFSSSD